MTQEEKNAIRVLSDKVDDYHTTVEKHITACDSCRKTVDVLKTEMFGPPGQSVRNPGLKDRVSSLESSRKTMRMGLRASWAAMLVIIPAAAHGLWQLVKKTMGT